MPTPLIAFKDATNAANLDPRARFAVFYTDGLYANRAAVAKQCPLAKLFGITTTGETGEGIFALDCETGNLGAHSNAELINKAVVWVAKQIFLGVDPIAVYANNNLWESGLLAALSRFGRRIKRWDADWNGDPASMPAWADADQYADPGGVDLDIALANFFLPAPKPAPRLTFNQSFNVGFQRGFTVGYCRRGRLLLPVYKRPAAQAVAYNLGFQAGFIKGWFA